MWEIKKILCPTDFSEPSYGALKTAAEWATHYDAQLEVLHVMPHLDRPGMILDKATIEKAMTLDAQRHLQEVVSSVLPRQAGVRSLVRHGNPADEIASVINSENIDMLVISTHGLSGWSELISGTALDRIVFGSVAANIMRTASCPVLTVRGS